MLIPVVAGFHRFDWLDIVRFFQIGSAEADFLLDLTFEEMAYYFQKENCETEIQRWKGLEELLSAQ